ncbi:hypothetical protein GCM10027411_06590 [Microbacterium aureliae]
MGGTAVFSAEATSKPACTCAVAKARAEWVRSTSGMRTIVEPERPHAEIVCRTVAPAARVWCGCGARLAHVRGRA